jgi:hypothetical protein
LSGKKKVVFLTHKKKTPDVSKLRRRAIGAEGRKTRVSEQELRKKKRKKQVVVP